MQCTINVGTSSFRVCYPPAILCHLPYLPYYLKNCIILKFRFQNSWPRILQNELFNWESFRFVSKYTIFVPKYTIYFSQCLIWYFLDINYCIIQLIRMKQFYNKCWINLSTKCFKYKKCLILIYINIKHIDYCLYRNSCENMQFLANLY